MNPNHVFINCPFSDYGERLWALVFSVLSCGFQPRCALEEDDGGLRIKKIEKLIEECKYGIHDLSMVELTEAGQLPRFNMPFELGLFLGAKRFGDDNQSRKITIVLDTERFRYLQFISDIRGQDITFYEPSERGLIISVVNALRTSSRRRTIPGGIFVADEYRVFREALPIYARESRVELSELNYVDIVTFSTAWLLARASNQNL